MGVHGLWTILDPIREHLPLRELGGKRIAIDLSGWICGDMKANQGAQTLSKLYIRNMIFRILALLREAILPVAVTDGVAPVLKAGTMAERRQPSIKGSQNPAKNHLYSLQRVHFSRISSHCCRLLTALGVPCVRSPGEAEAMCAFLNEAGLVEGCVTNDGDSFLYGASVVYRNFSLNPRDASVEFYDAKRISTDLGICRKGLVLLGLALGCDFWPAGVAKVGRVSVASLLPQLDMGQAFDRLTGTYLSGDTHESPVWKSPTWGKIVDALVDCPVEEILGEFLKPCSLRGWSLPGMDSMVWSRPKVKQMVELCLECLDWNPSYSLAQFVPLLAIWIVRQRIEALSSDNDAFLEETQPLRIVRKRSVNFLPCFEVEWKRLSADVWSKDILSRTTDTNSLLVSLKSFFTDEGYRFTVPSTEFRAAFPHMSLAFESLDLVSISAKLDALAIDLQEKPKNEKALKAQPVNPKKQTKRIKSTVPLDAFLRNVNKKELKQNYAYLPNWDSTPETSPERISLKQRLSATNASSVQNCNGPLEWDHFSPPEDSRLQYISVRLNTMFEQRRLTINTSLLSPSPISSIVSQDKPTVSAVSISTSLTEREDDEFSFFKTPVRLVDRLK